MLYLCDSDNMDEEKTFPVHIEEKKESKEDTIELNFIKKPFFWQITSVVLLILFVISLFAAFGSPTAFAVKDVGGSAAKERVQNYVETVLAGRAVAVLGEVNEVAGLYEIDLTIQGQTIESYVTKDGVLFFPTSIDLDEFERFGGQLPVISDTEVSNIEPVEEISDTKPVDNTEDSADTEIEDNGDAKEAFEE